MRIADLIGALEAFAPLEAAESWDRVGLQAGDPARALTGPVVLTIDLTERVLAEAVGLRAGAIIAYHPPIWNPLKSLGASTAVERIVRGAIEAGIAVYTPHTALDAAPGGINDWLCAGVSRADASRDDRGAAQRIAGDVRALVPHQRRARSREVKLVVFVPEEAADRVRSALGTAGAGGIGTYRLCSFGASGVGTFLPMEGAHPAVGEVGRLERVRELRLEMVCSRAALPLAIETLREFHPYEEPAFDVYELEAEPVRRAGAGRRLVLDQPATMRVLGERLRDYLGTPRVRLSVPWDDAERAVSTVAVVAGAGESMLDDAAREGCQVFVTGEMKHHEVQRAAHLGIGVIVAGHTNTERGYLPRLAARLERALPGVLFVCSRADRDILVSL